MEPLEVICGIPPGKDTGILLATICEYAKRKGKYLELKVCGSKCEVEFAVHAAKKNAVVLLQEMLEENPYRAWEVAELRDIRDISVVISVARYHYGTSFLAILYAAGILDAVFEEDANAESLTERLLTKRSRKDCRKYYGIQTTEDAIAVLDIIDKETLERYVRHIGAGVNSEDMLKRYQEIEKKLSYTENCFLAEHLPAAVLEDIKEEGGLNPYRRLAFNPIVKNKRKKRR